MENLKKYYSGEARTCGLQLHHTLHTSSSIFLRRCWAASPDLQKWLNEHHPFLWARSKFSPDIKCDYINNNLAESWNAWIKEHNDCLCIVWQMLLERR
jgi:hypothetical protein